MTYFNTGFITQIFTALYLLWLSSNVSQGALNKFVFKFVPTVTAFILVLLAFKVI